jgi:hypothetical protein
MKKQLIYYAIKTGKMIRCEIFLPRLSRRTEEPACAGEIHGAGNFLFLL